MSYRNGRYIPRPLPQSLLCEVQVNTLVSLEIGTKHSEDSFRYSCWMRSCPWQLSVESLSDKPRCRTVRHDRPMCQSRSSLNCSLELAQPTLVFLHSDRLQQSAPVSDSLRSRCVAADWKWISRVFDGPCSVQRRRVLDIMHSLYVVLQFRSVHHKPQLQIPVLCYAVTKLCEIQIILQPNKRKSSLSWISKWWWTILWYKPENNKVSFFSCRPLNGSAQTIGYRLHPHSMNYHFLPRKTNPTISEIMEDPSPPTGRRHCIWLVRYAVVVEFFCGFCCITNPQATTNRTNGNWALGRIC